MMTLKEFIASQPNLEFRSTHLIADPRGDDSSFGPAARHFQVVIRMVGQGPTRQYATIYSQGSAHTRSPRLADVLDCLRLDATGVEQGFAQWCDEYGLDTDSRKAFATYEACERTRKGLLHVLGREAFNTLMNDVEAE